METETSEFLIKPIQIGEDVYTEFRKSRLDEKSVKFFDFDSEDSQVAKSISTKNKGRWPAERNQFVYAEQ